MEKHLIILIAQYRLSPSERAYIAVDSYMIEKANRIEFEAAVKDFRDRVSAGGFEIVDLVCHIPDEKMTRHFNH